MLAIQRPRMGSSQPSNGSGPFGYSFNRGDDLLFFEPPEPAPGQPLLSFEESQSLNNILEQLTSNHYNEMAFGEGLNFSEAWQQLPPQFMGTATTFGPQPAQPFPSSIFDFSDNVFDAIQFPTNTMLPPPPPHHHRHSSRNHMRTPSAQSTPADAAAVLAALQSGQAARSNGLSRGSALPSQPVVRPNGLSVATQNRFIGGRSSPIRQAVIPATVSPLAEHRDENLFADMAFGNPHGQSTPQLARQLPEDISFGSDMSFAGHQSFIPNSSRDTAEVLENERIKYLDCLKLSTSAANTRPSSPHSSGNTSPSGGRNGKVNGHLTSPIDLQGPPSKRRRSNIKEETDEDDLAGASSSKAAHVARKRKSKEDLTNEELSPSENSSGKRRRKSNVNGSKPPRENLSETQKRANHIRSEQRRREIIKIGFEELQEIVPNLKTGGYSKSSMLQIAAEWLDDLMKGNELLS